MPRNPKAVNRVVANVASTFPVLGLVEPLAASPDAMFPATTTADRGTPRGLAGLWRVTGGGGGGGDD